LIIAPSLLAASLAVAPLGDSQFQCKQPAANEWLKQGTYKGPGPQVSSDFIRPVTKDLPGAISLLKKRSAIRLSEKNLGRFVGRDFRWTQDRRLKPYLVRAVFPSGNPMVGADWDGDDLYVFAGGLGCAAYKKHPVVMFLGRKPKRVFVRAMSAL
jgi:hypothetical protein